MRDASKLAVMSWMAMGCGTEPARDLRVETTFTIPPGEERYECYRVNVDDDVYAATIATSAAPGVHHQILGVSDQTEPEGTTACGLALDISKAWIFQASDTPETFSMPPGVAYPISGGSQLLLQMHLFNPGDQPIQSTISVDLLGIAEDQVEARAQLIAAGSLNIDLPARQATTVRSKCTLDQSVSVFGVLPHMHFLGTTFRTWVDGRQDAMLYNGPFMFDSQMFKSFEPIELAQGTALNVECDFMNTTDQRVTYGSSALNEMCFALTYYYPAVDGQGPLCLN